MKCSTCMWKKDSTSWMQYVSTLTDRGLIPSVVHRCHEKNSQTWDDLDHDSEPIGDLCVGSLAHKKKYFLAQLKMLHLNMKTILQWFQGASNSKEQLLSNLDRQWSDKQVNSLGEAINAGFYWYSSPEGFDYWDKATDYQFTPAQASLAQLKAAAEKASDISMR